MSFKNLNKEQQVPRRHILLWASGAALLGLVGQSLAGLLQFFKPLIEPGSFGGKVNAGQVGEFAPGSITHVSKGRFYISRLEDGGVLAMWHRCTHLGCTVPWRQDEDRFHCPCHGGIYNKKGEVLAGPPPRPLDLFPVEIVEGKIVVDTGRVIERNRFDPSQETLA
jgi:cytochrome b6-f complex iron-sulfur subunit